MYIIGGFDGQRLNDMHHISLPLPSGDDKNISSMLRRRVSNRPYSSTSGFLNSSASEYTAGHLSELQSSADSEHSPRGGGKEEAGVFTLAQKNAMSKKIKRLQ